MEDGCGAGQVAYKDELKGDAVRECSLGGPSDCPTGFSCQYSSQFSRSQCCGVSAGIIHTKDWFYLKYLKLILGCPANSVAYIDPSSGRAQNCNAMMVCPSGFSCQSLGTGVSVCCSSKQDVPPPSRNHGFVI